MNTSPAKPASTPVPSAGILEVNLSTLAARSPAAAAAIRLAIPRSDLVWTQTEDGVPAARLGASGPLLCSARRPLDEARTIVDTLPLENAGGIAVQGFGLGYHVFETAARLGRHGAMFIFEPDVSLLRAVLERVDFSPVFAATHTILITSADDHAAIASAVHGVEGLLALGVKFLEHPAQAARLGPDAKRFADHFTTTMRAVKTNVVTTLMHADITLRNQLMNLGRYASAPGVRELEGLARGRPAIIVAAGPSLRRNLDLLRRPEVQDRFVIIAVQTVLKQMLARGIRPHFVTALDYHEISRRFYEGLTEKDVEGVTLVAEAKANAAILDSFPGTIRCPADKALDTVLGTAPGTGLARPMGKLPLGATVAHLAYYLARHLGCEPAIFIGQDLGFTDGQYYAAGAAIHQVWSGELNPFTTLEALEWQRIIRNRAHLHRAEDQLGRPIYTDEQMNAYRLQFERDFAPDAARGLTIIDATEGGVRKQHTTAMTLAEAIERHMPGTAHDLRSDAAAPADHPVPPKKLDARARLVRTQCFTIERHCRETARLLEEMLAHHDDQNRVNRLITRVNQIRDQVAKEEPGFELVQLLNQTGTLKRVRADRSLWLARDLEPMERQRRQIRRDIQNVTWLADAAVQLGSLFDTSIKALAGGPKLTAEPPPPRVESDTEPASRPRRIAAVIPLDPAVGGLNTPRDLSAPVFGAWTPLALLLTRLSRATQLDRIVVLADDPTAARALIGASAARLKIPIDVLSPAGPILERRLFTAAARLWSRECWRGGISNQTVYDEAFSPAATLAVMEHLDLDDIVPINPDWCLLDPIQLDALVLRHRQHTGGPQPHRFTFAHAAPGLGACVLDRSLVRELHEKTADAGGFATLGGVLGYIPVAPSTDPIAKPNCHTPDPIVRDAPARFIPDTAAGAAMLRRALEPLGTSLAEATAEQIAQLVTDHLTRTATWADQGPQDLTLELNTGRLTSGVRGLWLRAAHDTIERPPISLALASRLVAQLRPDATLTLSGAGDPLLHPDLPRLITLAKKAGLAGVHLRTDLLAPRETIEAAIDAGVDVVSVDVMASTPETYRRLMGVASLDQVEANLEHLLARRAGARAQSGQPIALPLVVPRLTRCDAVYAEIEAFYDKWTLVAGSATIDPLPPHAVSPSGRIEPLPPPRSAARRLARQSMRVLCDGRVPTSEHDLAGDRILGDLTREDLASVWRRWCQTRRDLAPADPPRDLKPVALAAV